MNCQQNLLFWNCCMNILCFITISTNIRSRTVPSGNIIFQILSPGQLKAPLHTPSTPSSSRISTGTQPWNALTFKFNKTRLWKAKPWKSIWIGYNTITGSSSCFTTLRWILIILSLRIPDNLWNINKSLKDSFRPQWLMSNTILCNIFVWLCKTTV